MSIIGNESVANRNWKSLPQRNWPRLSLAWQFVLASSAILIVSMLAQGALVSAEIRRGVEFDAGIQEAARVESYVAPAFAGFRPGSRISLEQKEAVDRFLSTLKQGMRVALVNVWDASGAITYSTAPSASRKGEATPQALEALEGNICSAFYNDGRNDLQWAGVKAPFLRVGVPIRDEGGAVVAAIEIYRHAEELRDELSRAQWEGAFVSGGISVAMILALFLIVARGSRTIELQRRSQAERVKELSFLLDHNAELQRRIERAAKLTASENEHYLRRLAADLHDGPAQYIGFALLRLPPIATALAGDGAGTGRSRDLKAIEGALSDAMNDVRNICAGLSLPEMEGVALSRALAAVVRQHETRTGTQVASTFGPLPENVPHFVKVCLCRFVQEGLSNAFRHADGVGQRVEAWMEDGAVSVAVADAGPGISADPAPSDRVRLGLSGLRHRLESVGGKLAIESCPGQGTTVAAAIPLNACVEC